MLKKSDYIWAFIGYISEAGVYAILTPVMATFLESHELGLWYTFMSIYMFIGVLDAGFSPIITRNAAYCMGGASRLVKEGIPPKGTQDGPNYMLLGNLFKANRKMITWVSFVALVGLWTLGSFYIKFITRTEFKFEYMVAWWIFSLAIVINLYVISIPAFIRGIGDIAKAQQIVTIGRVSQLIICTLFVVTGLGLLGLASGFLISAVLIGGLSSTYYYFHIKPRFIQRDSKGMPYGELYITLIHNSSKLLINSFGAYMIMQANTLLCSAFIDLETTATYSLTVQIIQAVTMISSIILQINVPGISMAIVSKQNEKRNMLFSGSIVLYWGFSIVGLTMVIFMGSSILKFIGGNTTLLEFPLILIVAIENFLERNCSNHNQIIMSENKIPFIKSTLSSGFIIVLLSMYTLAFTNNGLFGIILIQGIVQGAYNYWHWPLLVKKKLQLSLKKIGIYGMKYIMEEILHV